MPIFNIYKPAGLTPLEVLEKLRTSKAELIREKMTYAGRLDPLAEGVMLVVTGEDIARKEQFLNLPKTYEVDILLGVGTDTGDVLGLVNEFKLGKIDLTEVKKASAGLVSRRWQTAPRYSAPGIDGKEFTKEVEVFTVQVADQTEISAPDLLLDIEKRVGEVIGDFRQAKITTGWQKWLADNNQMFPVVKITISASSGTYMRVLAEELGKVLNVPALAYKIKRTKVGEYSITDSIVL
ncbi:MAG: hypothetical protein A2571_00070 [Candidatus Vogelbacteria bacterium RIFOXYD1_FULL_44_32]|uniref:tRNA pseudouridine(55) synthase n=1 Tax=Candidatus Vogelbacteria bacterium RIFOXYD1_FULL_44_32 TaxID=1802438 RepID=A0A1G2QFI8_9BACT|nr:MAG: hypothetical protein A2571_00070 [Candidatus Vogelbacteria bacterium RIFOXYD1_FULL_44_32]